MIDEHKKLEEAGWVPEEHLGIRSWRCPESGHLYPQEAAITLTAQKEAAEEDARLAEGIVAQSSSGAIRSERSVPCEVEEMEEEIVEDAVIVGGVIVVVGVTLMMLSIWPG